MSNKVSIVTDTIASVPPELVERYGISIVPFHVILGGEDYGEVGVDREQFRIWNRNKDNLPTTSAPSIGEILDVWRSLTSSGKDIVHIAMSSGMSMEYNFIEALRTTGGGSGAGGFSR